jgi:hypothetical protein
MSNIISSLAVTRVNSTNLAVLGYTFDHAVARAVSMHSGQQFPSLERVSGASPRAQLSVPARAAYDLVGLSVLKATTFTSQFRKFADYVPAAGSVHPQTALAASAAAALHLRRISASPDQPALADVEAVLLSADGTTNPLAYTTNNALLTLAGQPVEHTLGPVSINGTVVPGVTSIEIDFGSELDVAARNDGALYPTVCARIQAMPKLVIGHSDAFTVLSTLGLLGLNITANVVAYLRQYNSTTGVIDTGATAMSFTVASGRCTPIQSAAQQGGLATTGFEVTALSASDTHPFAVAVNATAPSVA